MNDNNDNMEVVLSDDESDSLSQNSNSSSNNLNENIVTANFICNKRLCENTKGQYKNKSNHFLEWIEKTYPMFVNKKKKKNNKKWRCRVHLHLITAEIMKEFFGHICKKRNKKTNEYLVNPKSKKPLYQSYQHVNGYSSSLKDLYKKERVKMSDDILLALSEFLGGYKNQIGNKLLNKIIYFYILII
jgi:hypothetical protein